MEAITPLDLSEIQVYLQNSLQEELGEDVRCEVNSWVQEETLLVFIQCLQSDLKLDQTIWQNIKDKLSKTATFSSYQLKVYWLLDGGIYPLNPSSHSLVPSSLTPLQITESLDVRNLSLSLKKRQYSRPFSKMIGIGLGFSLGIGLLYILTRPCAVGSCPQLDQVARDTEETIKKIDGVASEADLLSAKKNLSRSIDLLKPIPPWSAHYRTAIALLSDYERQLLSLEALVTASQQADQSQQSMTNQSQSVSEWQSSKTQLEEAISRLPDSDVPIALQVSVDSKKRQYNRTLAMIEQRMKGEKTATTRLKQGIEAGQLALTRQKMAQSLEDWQLVAATWQTAISRLQAIPVNTTPYNQSRQLLQEYNYQRVKAEGNKQQAKQAVNLFKTAQEQARQAQVWQEQKQWSKAVELWRNALTTLQQIPSTSIYAQQAKPLIASYQMAFNQAEVQLKMVLAKQELTKYLDSLCQNPEPICQYNLQNNIIQVRLTEDYHQKLVATATQAQQQNDQRSQLNIMNHISRIENNLRSLSLRSRKTIELYHADGRLMMTFQPN